LDSSNSPVPRKWPNRAKICNYRATLLFRENDELLPDSFFGWNKPRNFELPSQIDLLSQISDGRRLSQYTEVAADVSTVHTLSSSMNRARENASERWPDSEFKRVFLKHYGRVLGVLLRLLGDRMRAEEVANDAFWRLYQHAPMAEDTDNVGGWLYRTATNLGIDVLRASARRVRYEQELGKERPTPGPRAGPLDAVLVEEKRSRVRAVLASIRPVQAQLLILRASGLSYKESAQVLDTKPSGIGTMLNRAEGEFRERYLELYGNEEEV
jgi:RNA polymerase sigma-70 factor, ECF subfamily